MSKTKNLYQRINLAILWFLNTTNCRHKIILAFIIYKMAFDNRIDHEYYCDNYIYNHEKTGQISVFEA